MGPVNSAWIMHEQCTLSLKAETHAKKKKRKNEKWKRKMPDAGKFIKIQTYTYIKRIDYMFLMNGGYI